MISKNNAKRIISLSVIGMVITLLMADFKYASKYGFWASLPYTQTIIYRGVEHEEYETGGHKESEPNECSGSAYLCYMLMEKSSIKRSYKYSIAYSTRDGLVFLSLILAFGLFALFRKNDS